MTRMSELTRYFMRALNLVVQAVADKDGEWVRFEDVAPRIAELEAALKAERQRVVELEKDLQRYQQAAMDNLDWCKAAEQRAEAAEAKYQDDLNAAALIVLGAGGITGHADTFHSLTAEWVDRMKAAEAKLAELEKS